MRTKILIETTIQVHRLVDETSVRQRLDRVLADHDVITTSFVLREFLRTIIRDIYFVYDAAQGLPELDCMVALENLSRILVRHPLGYSSRAAKRILYVIAMIQENFAQLHVPRRKLLRFLELTASQLIVKFFEIPLPNGSHIDLKPVLTDVDDDPDEMQNWIDSHQPLPHSPPFPAGAARFLHDRQAAVHTVEVHLHSAAARERDGRLMTMLERMRNMDGQYDFLVKLTPTTRGNWALGDLLIALETPKEAAIYTTDKHYGILCRALGKSRHKAYTPWRDGTDSDDAAGR